MLKQKLDYEYTTSNIAEAEKKKVFDHLNIKDQEHQSQVEKLVAEVWYSLILDQQIAWPDGRYGKYETNLNQPVEKQVRKWSLESNSNLEKITVW